METEDKEPLSPQGTDRALPERVCDNRECQGTFRGAGSDWQASGLRFSLSALDICGHEGARRLSPPATGSMTTYDHQAIPQAGPAQIRHDRDDCWRISTQCAVCHANIETAVTDHGEWSHWELANSVVERDV
jgi:hypothetical protein